MKKIVYLFALAIMACSCAATSSIPSITRQSLYGGMYEEKPAVLLVMPPINNSSTVGAKEYLYSSISKPLIEAGYYVISPMLGMDILREESAYDAEVFVESSLAGFKKYFGADAVVFSEIYSWTKQGFGIRTDLRYFIRSTTSGDIIFDRRCNLYLDLSTNSGSNSLLGQLIDLAASAINTATTDHIVAARLANNYIFEDIPRGKYSPDYLQDQNFKASEKDITTTIK